MTHPFTGGTTLYAITKQAAIPGILFAGPAGFFDSLRGRDQLVGGWLRRISAALARRPLPDLPIDYLQLAARIDSLEINSAAGRSESQGADHRTSERNSGVRTGWSRL